MAAHLGFAPAIPAHMLLQQQLTATPAERAAADLHAARAAGFSLRGLPSSSSAASCAPHGPHVLAAAPHETGYRPATTTSSSAHNLQAPSAPGAGGELHRHVLMLEAGLSAARGEMTELRTRLERAEADRATLRALVGRVERLETAGRAETSSWQARPEYDYLRAEVPGRAAHGCATSDANPKRYAEAQAFRPMEGDIDYYKLATATSRACLNEWESVRACAQPSPQHSGGGHSIQRGTSSTPGCCTPAAAQPSLPPSTYSQSSGAQQPYSQPYYQVQYQATAPLNRSAGMQHYLGTPA